MLSKRLRETFTGRQNWHDVSPKHFFKELVVVRILVIRALAAQASSALTLIIATAFGLLLTLHTHVHFGLLLTLHFENSLRSNTHEWKVNELVHRTRPSSLSLARGCYLISSDSNLTTLPTKIFILCLIPFGGPTSGQ